HLDRLEQLAAHESTTPREGDLARGRATPLPNRPPERSPDGRTPPWNGAPAIECSAGTAALYHAVTNASFRAPDRAERPVSSRRYVRVAPPAHPPRWPAGAYRPKGLPRGFRRPPGPSRARRDTRAGRGVRCCDGSRRRFGSAGRGRGSRPEAHT